MKRSVVIGIVSATIIAALLGIYFLKTTQRNSIHKQPKAVAHRTEVMERLIAQTKDMIAAYRNQLQSLKDLKHQA